MKEVNEEELNKRVKEAVDLALKPLNFSIVNGSRGSGIEYLKEYWAMIEALKAPLPPPLPAKTFELGDDVIIFGTITQDNKDGTFLVDINDDDRTFLSVHYSDLQHDPEIE